MLELLLVFAIVGLMAGISMGGLRSINRLLAERESQFLMTELQLAVRMYRLEWGRVPESFLSGELALNEDESGWRRELQPYLERQDADRVLEDGFGNTRLYMVVDVDDNHWIAGSKLSSLAVADRPERIWSRTAIYSLDAEGNLVCGSWRYDD